MRSTAINAWDKIVKHNVVEYEKEQEAKKTKLAQERK
jgi:hypothetical protein